MNIKVISIIPKTEKTKFKNELDKKFRIKIKIITNTNIAKIFIDTMKSDFE